MSFAKAVRLDGDDGVGDDRTAEVEEPKKGLWGGDQ